MTLLAALLVVTVEAASVIVLGILWIAHGEADANGDPERDAGYDDDEIAAMSADWDRGSYETANRLDLDLDRARRMNRDALRDAAGH